MVDLIIIILSVLGAFILYRVGVVHTSTKDAVSKTTSEKDTVKQLNS